MTTATRPCLTTFVHPYEVEDLARRLETDATDISPAYASNEFLRAACERLHPEEVPVQPVTIEIRQDHPYKSKGPNRQGCAHCNGARLAAQHFEVPSLNDGGSSMNRFAYQALKKAVSDPLETALRASALERCEAVTVEVLIGFPSRRERDEGNHRWMIEKALGDVLVRGGWLPDDTFWPTRRYSMGNLEGVHTPHEHWLRMTLFPTVATVAPAGLAGQAPLL